MDRLRIPSSRIVLVLLWVVVLGGIVWWNVHRFTPLPPIPPNALNQTITRPSHGASQILTYETDLTVPALIAFYQTALTPTGWHYRCSSMSPDAPCWHYWGSPTNQMIVFARGTPGTATWETLDVVVEEGPTPAHLRVRISQPLRGPRWNDSPPPVVVPASPLVGEWISSLAGPTAPLVLLREDGRVQLHTADSLIIGTYDATPGDVRMQMTSAGFYGGPELCRGVPAFLQPWCHATPSVPMTSYPTPVPGSADRYPLPSGPISPAQAIDVRFTVTITATELLLTDPAGRRTRFQRVVSGR